MTEVELKAIFAFLHHEFNKDDLLYFKLLNAHDIGAYFKNTNKLFATFYLDKLRQYYQNRIMLLDENKELKKQLEVGEEQYNDLVEENEKMKEDILFCLRSIKQEMEMSTDSRTRSEMESCYEILKKYMS